MRGGGGPGVVGPGVARVAALHFLLHFRVGVGPEAAQVLGDLQRRILVSSGGVTWLVNRLVKRGLVERRPCADDKRARYAALTARGEAFMRRIFPEHAEAIRRAMSGLGLAALAWNLALRSPP